MADIASFGFAWDISVDWSDTGLYNHALSDVSETWLRASFEQGTARRSNPQRPTIVTGRGTITLIGNNYVPGLSTRLTAAQLQARHLIRFRLGTALLFDGYVQEARHLEGTGDGGIFTEFQVEGLLERRGRAALELTQAATSTTTTAAAVLQQLRETYGVAASDFEQNIQSTPFADYTFEGPVQQYASQFGQVAGGLMVARPGGELALIDPTRLPSPLPRVFRGTDYMVLGATTEFDQEQLWNKALIQYDGPETPGSGTGTGSVTDPGAGGASGVVTGLTIANPASGVKIEDMAATLTVGAATAQWREVEGDPGSGTGTGSVTDPGQSDVRGVDTSLTLNDPAAGHVIEELGATLTVGAATGTWQEIEGDAGSGTGTGSVTDPGQSDLRGVDTSLTLNDPAAGHVIEELAASITVGAGMGTWQEIEGDPGSGNASGTVTDPGQSDLRGVDTNLTLNDPATGHVIEELDATLTVGAATGSWREVEGDPGSGTGAGTVTDPGAFGASGVLTSLVIANPDANHRIEDMAAVLTVGAATANYIFNDRDLTDSASSSDVRFSNRDTVAEGMIAKDVTVPDGWRISNVSATATYNVSGTGVLNASTTLPVTARYSGSTLIADIALGAPTENPRGNYYYSQYPVVQALGRTYYLGFISVDQGQSRLSWVPSTNSATLSQTGRTHNITVEFEYTITNSTVFTLPAPTRRTAPSWEVERVSRSQNPNNRNNSFARVTLVGTDAPGTWRINDSGTNVDVSSWEHSTGGKTYRLGGIAVSFAISWKLRDTRTHTVTPSRLQAPSWEVERVSRSTDPTNRNRKFVRVTVANAHEPGRWRINDGTNSVDLSGWSHTANRREYRITGIAVTFAVTWRVRDTRVHTVSLTRRTAPIWDVDRVSRSTDPTNRNRRFVRVTLANVHQPGTWRLNDGTRNVDLTSWERTANRRIYRISAIGVSFAVSWRVRDTRVHTVTPTRQAAPNWIVDRVSRSTDPSNRNRKFVRVTVGNAHEPGTWRINDGTNSVDLTSWTRTANNRIYRITGIAVSFAVSWRVRDTRTHTVTPTRRTAPNWDVDRVGLTDNPANANNRLVRVTVLGTNSPGTWRINDGTHTVDLTTWERTANRREYKLLTIAVSFAVTWILDDENVYTLEAQNDDSITEWGERTLMFPVWFRRTATAALQSRINALAVPRNIHVVDFSLDQSTAARQGHVVALQPGEFMGLVLDDPRTRTEISAWCFVMNMRYDLHRNRPPVKRLTLLTVGTTTPTDSATAPGRPAAPMVSADSFTSLEARWAPPASDGGRGIRSYSLRYKESSGSSWTTVGGLNALEYRITGLTSGTQYDVQVRAVNAIGASQWSPSGQATTQREPIAPARPAAPTWSNVQATTATLTWVAPNNNGAAITSYDLRYRPTGTSAWTTDAGLQGLSRDLTGLMESTQYEAQVRARNRVGASQWSASRTATTPVAPRSGSGEPIQVALTLDEARWALTVVAAGEPIDVTAALEDATGAALLETGAGERIDVSAALSDASGNVLTFGTGAPIAASVALEDDAEGAVTYFGTGEPIAASAALEDDATGVVLLETGDGEPIDATVALPDATGRDIKPYPAPENARERTRIPFGNLVQVTFEWDAPTEAARQGDLWQYEYQTRVGTGNWSSSSTVGSTTLVSGARTFTANEEYDFRVRAVYVFNAQFFRSDWATYSSSVEPTSAAGEPIAVSVTLPDGGGAELLVTGDGEPIQVTVALTEAREPVTGLPPYALTLNSLPLTLNDHVLTLPPPSD